MSTTGGTTRRRTTEGTTRRRLLREPEPDNGLEEPLSERDDGDGHDGVYVVQVTLGSIQLILLHYVGNDLSAATD